MSFAIVAELPLGTYHGSMEGGGIDRAPAPARLHAALLCAAAQGPRAEVDGDRLAPCAEDAAALRWLEEHPPDGIVVPRLQVNAGTVVAYRQLGLLLRNEPRLQGRTTASVAVDGPYAWTWTTEPDESVRTALTGLCCDVTAIGRSESPVRLRVGDAEPTHRLDSEADLFGGSGVDVEVSAPGRAELLAAEHAAARARVSPSSDKVGASEDEIRRPMVRGGLRPVRYVEPDREPVDAPWERAVLLPVRGDAPGSWERDRVRWAVGLHRALISLVGDGAPAVLTGAYVPEAPRPTNRVAIHPVTGAEPITGWRPGRPGFVLLLPRGADDEDLRALALAVRALRLVRGPRGRTVAVEHRAADVLPADAFWAGVPDGHARYWRTEPAAVPETRALRHGPWSLADAATLSVGMVWRDHIAEPGRGEEWYRSVAGAAADRGVEVVAATRVTDGDLGRFVHKVNPGTIVQPYRAELRLGDLAGSRTVVAIGQSRHLGGGLLVPHDVPVGDGS